MALTNLLELPIIMIDKRQVECPDNTCLEYGRVLRCYLPEEYQKCNKFMEVYKERK